MGEVAAGRYDVTVAYHEPGSDADADFVLVNSEEIKVGRDTFALRVRGQSMIDNEIDNGDIIIVQSQDWADDGDFVIACLTDSTDTAGFVDSQAVLSPSSGRPGSTATGKSGSQPNSHPATQG